MSDCVVENVFLSAMKKDKITSKEVKETLQKLFALKLSELPKLADCNGKELPKEFLGYLLICHETRARKKIPGIAEEIKGCVELVDTESLQNALGLMADKYLGLQGASKKKDLAAPICRYASAELINKLADSAVSWTRTPLTAFRKGIVYSNIRRAMLFADAYGDLEACAKMRGYDVDEFRDKIVSNLGLTKDGKKIYQIGDASVIAELQTDLTFELHLANGERIADFPDADPSAQEDYLEMTDSLKRIVILRKDVLLEQFLSGHVWNSDIWKNAFTENPVLASIARLLVWTQNNITFTLSEDGAICSDGAPYQINECGIALAHPKEMKQTDLYAWMKYFNKNRLKQPFVQIWEPFFNETDIKEDRYKGCTIPYGAFEKRRRHGIVIQKFDLTGRVINLKDCTSWIERTSGEPWEIKDTDGFEIKKLSFENYTRFVNHHIAYFDYLTIENRIAKDDVSIADRLDAFTLAQIAEFIEFATKQNSTNCAALLLEYKQTHFPDADPMDTFVLEW